MPGKATIVVALPMGRLVLAKVTLWLVMGPTGGSFLFPVRKSSDGFRVMTTRKKLTRSQEA